MRASWMTAAAVSCVALLASGWAGLEALLPGGLPLGNAVAAAAPILAAWAALRLSARGSRARRFAAFALFVALAWLPVSVALAGNLELNFGASTGSAWLAFTAFTFLAAFGALLAAGVSAIRRRRPQPGR